MSYITLFSLVNLAVFYTLTINATGVLDKLKPCGFHEVRDPCGPLCEDRCNAVRPETCSILQCSYSGCRCKDGFARNPYTNRCIERGQCPFDGCARGEIAGACGKSCEGTCSNPNEPTKCQTMHCSKWECRCDLQGGFVRNQRTGQCVRMGESCDMK